MKGVVGGGAEEWVLMEEELFLWVIVSENAAAIAALFRGCRRSGFVLNDVPLMEFTFARARRSLPCRSRRHPHLAAGLRRIVRTTV